MLAPAAKPVQSVTLRFAVHFAWRELRGGLRGFGVFVACIALGVMAIAGVGSVAASLNDGLAGAGQTILGGDIAFAAYTTRSKSGRARFPRYAWHGLRRRHIAGDGKNRRRPLLAGRGQSG